MDEELEKIKKKKLEELMRNAKRDDKMEVVKEVTDTNFEDEVVAKSNDVPVVVDFWASWCKPCRMLGPVMEEFAQRYEGKFILAKVNVDSNPMMSRQYGIRGIPAVKLFKNGKVVDEFVGALPAPAIKEWLDKNI